MCQTCVLTRRESEVRMWQSENRGMKFCRPGRFVGR